MTTEFLFRPASRADAQHIASLVNISYRGEQSRQGWTTEADLLDGQRTHIEEIEHLITAADSMLLLCLGRHDIVGSVLLEQHGDTAHLGMFVVQPALQGRGIGRQLLAEAEQLVKEAWGVKKIQLEVISLRHELIQFYERRGYTRTVFLREFPINPLWQPKVMNLQLEMLEKML